MFQRVSTPDPVRHKFLREEAWWVAVELRTAPLPRKRTARAQAFRERALQAWRWALELGSSAVLESSQERLDARGYRQEPYGAWSVLRVLNV